jgi:steroid delta-isomerase-like uncharacterized protein
MNTSAIIEAYYAAFNRGDFAAMVAMVADDFAHDPNQSTRRVGKPLFSEFLAKMNRCYREQVTELTVMSHGTRGAAEFVIVGDYVVAEDGLPAARGQSYRLAVGAFFEINNGCVARVTNYYNLEDWLAQVSK